MGRKKSRPQKGEKNDQKRRKNTFLQRTKWGCIITKLEFSVIRCSDRTELSLPCGAAALWGRGTAAVGGGGRGHCNDSCNAAVKIVVNCRQYSLQILCRNCRFAPFVMLRMTLSPRTRKKAGGACAGFACKPAENGDSMFAANKP